MGREVRRVPPTWKHPKDARGRYRPLFGGGRLYATELRDWQKGKEKWDAGLREDFAGGWVPRTGEELTMPYSEWAGHAPERECYMPEWTDAERTHLQMYETTSEGTPISPVMATAEDLARWLADNNASALGDEGATYEEWLGMIGQGWSVSAVFDPVRGMRSGVAACLDWTK